MTLRYARYITRGMLREERDTLFVFGDNMGRSGLGGQAREMRGEPNAVGIPTKWQPTNHVSAFFKDTDMPMISGLIDAAFGRLFMQLATGGDVVWPSDGIGTGLAELPTRAPVIWDYIETGRKALERLAAKTSLASQQEPAGPPSASPGEGPAG